MSDLKNGKRFAREIVECIRDNNDDEYWLEWHDEAKWEDAIEDALTHYMEMDRTKDISDLGAFMFNAYSGDEQALACLVTYGFAHMLAVAVNDADYLGEECALLA